MFGCGTSRRSLVDSRASLVVRDYPSHDVWLCRMDGLTINTQAIGRALMLGCAIADQLDEQSAPSGPG